jgi:hypothetical protein
MTKPAILESADLAAFISFRENILPQPFVNAQGRVCFRFNDDITASVEAFYANEPTPIADYCQKLKLIRSMIFNMKGGRR